MPESIPFNEPAKFQFSDRMKSNFSHKIHLPLDMVGKLWYNIITYQIGGYKLEK